MVLKIEVYIFRILSNKIIPTLDGKLQLRNEKKIWRQFVYYDE